MSKLMARINLGKVVVETWKGSIDEASFQDLYKKGYDCVHCCDLRMGGRDYIFMREGAADFVCLECGETVERIFDDDDFDFCNTDDSYYTGEEIEIRLPAGTRDSLIAYCEAVSGLLDPRSRGIILPGYEPSRPTNSNRPIATPRKRSQKDG
jgi:hypothetical protein